MGIVISAGNALGSGAYSKQVVLPGEDAQAFGALEAQLVRDFDPVGMAEVAMVRDLAVLTWKKLRVDRIDHAVMTQFRLLPLIEETIQKSFGTDFLPQSMHRLVPFDPVTESEFNNACAVVKQAQAMLAESARAKTVARLRNKSPELVEELITWADDYAVNVDEWICGTSPEDGTPDLDEALEQIISSFETIVWLWENRERITTALQVAQDSRLLVYLKGGNQVTQRTFDDISRTFYRTLSELRRQQDWRIRRTAINVEVVTQRPPAPAENPTAATPT